MYRYVWKEKKLRKDSRIELSLSLSLSLSLFLSLATNGFDSSRRKFTLLSVYRVDLLNNMVGVL